MDYAEEIARVIVGPLAEKAGVRIAFDAHMTLVPQLANLIREYGEQCRRAGAEAMRASSKELRAIVAEAENWATCKNPSPPFPRPLLNRCRAALALPLPLPLPPAAEAASPAAGTTWTIEHDGFVGSEIGSYTTLEGKEGVVLQQVGTRVVHVYGRKWLKPSPSEEARAG